VANSKTELSTLFTALQLSFRPRGSRIFQEANFVVRSIYRCSRLYLIFWNKKIQIREAVALQWKLVLVSFSRTEHSLFFFLIVTLAGLCKGENF
jgi:hypothetical protein